MNKFEEIDAVYPPYIKEIRLLSAKPAALENASLDDTVPAVDKTDSAMQTYWSAINEAYDGV